MLLLLRNTEQEAVAPVDGGGARATAAKAADGAGKAAAGERGASEGRWSDDGDVVGAWDGCEDRGSRIEHGGDGVLDLLCCPGAGDAVGVGGVVVIGMGLGRGGREWLNVALEDGRRRGMDRGGGGGDG